MKHLTTISERNARLDARREILQEANKFRGGKTSLFARHIQKAVRICRFNNLVDSTTLTAAGFNAS